ncbi:IS1182 family transposase (plasmid) [Sphingobium sp. WTD-1]|uniref:IS1182 family transposase n=1 Tax=Sphingobium sp. WTD-1 TaxID=2979467 RepID=UPI000C914AAF|nr:IS1182 family transposase [Sphingobium sp. WTD-1]MAM83420.1 IS5/IS1182 family transposase [Acidobacteriota bacterium]WIA59029.1 IS1182 family transposase [Sphingobium sp. WTD-1]WIA59299.1 IS1182 family transposase [Sphingobium sp. WTD-1]
MGRFVEGADRRQDFLLPASLEDYVSQDNPVRLVEAFIDELDLQALGFSGATPADTGRPAYHPVTMLKIYLYGYLNRVQSSRRLEREAQRNIELMWLTGRLAPDFKTIANFRRDNGAALRGVCRQFVMLCRSLGLFSQAVVAVDGSKFKAVNNRDRNFTANKVARRIEQVDASIERYLAALDRADREPGDVAEARTDRIEEKLAGLRRHMQFLKDMESQVAAAPDHQVSLTDPDSRSMNSSGRGTGIVGYNVQAAVDTTHHLIIAHEVVTEGNDRVQLVPMGLSAKEAMGANEITVIADRGYYNGDQVLACEGTGVLPCIPKTHTAIGIKTGMFSRHDFIYDPEQDHYSCPAGAMLTKSATRSDRRDDISHYRNLVACHACALRPRCTPEKTKRLKRWDNEGVLDAMQARLDRMPDAMILRRRTVEHVFGTLKSWIGSAHLLTKGLEKVRTEISLSVLAYNIKRMIQIFGVQALIQAIRA